MGPRGFGKYEVLARLATGGAASIFLARQPGAAGFQKLVALKTLLPERANDADFVAMFLDEARLAARLNHPNCVQIYDLGRVKGVYYISMEYIFGETLWNLLTTVTKVKEPLPANHVAHIVASVCDGLHHAHELNDPQGRPFNLVHRDVSPQNVMISFEGQTKVLDFGIAKAETGRAPTMAGIVKGKFSYMSPEQITGGQVDRRSDIYSLGIVMFECLASRRLYRGDSPEEIAKLILEHRAPRLRDVVPDIPGPLDEICARALSRHPSKRYQSAQQMGEAIRNYLDDARYNQSASALSKLLKERFGDTIEQRRQVFEGALVGQYDEAELLRILDARAVRDLDLFPDDVREVTTPDFMETGAELGPVLPDRADSATDTHTEAHEDETSSARRQRDGWRVELNTPGGEVEPISVRAPGFLTPPTTDDPDPTRLDGDEPEGATVANIIEAVDGRTQLDSDSVAMVEGASPPAAPDPALDAPFPTRSTRPTYGGAAATLEARLAELDDASLVEDTVDADDRPPDPAVSLSGASDTAITPTFLNNPPFRRPEAMGAAVLETSPSVMPPVLSPADLRLVEDEDPDLTPPPRPAPIVTPPPVQEPVSNPRARYSLSAVLAALAFGLSIGIVIGMLLARLVFGMFPPPVETGEPSRVIEME
ncbi:MAG: protein kinase [Deltaproteobacteria bacterium]|nr:protein kinase [Deltaproteobacteria bacterium]